MNFIEDLPNSYMYSVILVVMNRLTKYTHFIPIIHPYTISEITQVFANNVLKLLSLPKSILSDRDPTFTRKFW